MRYLLVSLAKNHNFFGGMDEYMKEFTRICMATEDIYVCKNLERLLNTEISINKPIDKSEMLKNYKDLPREIDPNVLSQPSF